MFACKQPCDQRHGVCDIGWRRGRFGAGMAVVDAGDKFSGRGLGKAGGAYAISPPDEGARSQACLEQGISGFHGADVARNWRMAQVPRLTKPVTAD